MTNSPIWLIDELFRIGNDFIGGTSTAADFRVRLGAWLAVQPDSAEPSVPTDRALASLKTLIRHFVETLSAGQNSVPAQGQIDVVKRLCDVVVDTVQQLSEASQRPLPGFGDCRTFAAVASLRSAYWNAACEQNTRPLGYHPSHRVIRINDVPFAESIIPALLADGAEALGYSIIVEDVPWSELGAALYNGRIDVAFSNGQIIEQLRSAEPLFDRKLIYRGTETITYKKYPVIGRPTVPDNAKDLIGVPERSDFEDIARNKANTKDPGRIAFESATSGRRTPLIVNYSSVDDVLEAVVEGEVEFGLVGGLQHYYAVKQFGDGENGVRRVVDLDGGHPDPPARFWVAVSRRDEAEDILSAMHTLWNDVVVRDWRRVSTMPRGRLPSRLVEVVNSHKHRSFIEDFLQLKNLILDHDGEFAPRRRQPIEPYYLYNAP